MEFSKEQAKEEFLEIYNEYVKRDGADLLLDFLLKSDFFTAPASARYHLSVEGGLCQHSLNVYHCLKAYLERDRVKDTYGLNYSDESVVVCALLHDICKVNVYKIGFRNVKMMKQVSGNVKLYMNFMIACPMAMAKNQFI